MSAKAACCFVENGNPCDCGGVYRVTLDQLERTVAAKRAKKQPELLYDYFVTCDDEEYWVCAEHAYDVIKAHLRETYEVAKGKARMERRDLIKEVLWCTGTHENQDPDAAEKLAAHIVESNAPPKPDTPRRVSRPTGDHPVVGDDKVMKLRKLFDRALPFIHVQSFTYVLLITMLRSVLILNGIFEYGRHVWHGDKEGTDILRFCAVLLSKLAAATLAGVQRVKLAFRDAVVHAKGGGDAAKYGKTASKRRSLLARAMEAPHLLKRVDAKGRARAFQVGKVFLVDGSAAWMLDCVGKLDAPTVICRQHPEKAVLELDVLSKETYMVSFDSIYAISWDLRHDSTPQDKDGVVVITLAIVSSGLLQILALELVKKDVNTCRMLMNLQGLQPTILESALVEGGVPTPRAQLLRAVVRDPLVGEPTLSVDGHETPWQRVDLAQAVSAMRGPARLAVVPTTEPPPSLQSLIVAASATTGGLALKPAKAARRRKRARPEADAGPRTVVAKIEQSDKDALEKELVRNLKSLEAKWKGLYVRDEGMGFSGEILNFEWKNRSSGVRPAQFCAVVESHDCSVCESYSVLDLPEMVIAAESEQPAGVVLVYDRQQVDEFELLGDEEAKEMERMIPDEESEDEPEEDEL